MTSQKWAEFLSLKISAAKKLKQTDCNPNRLTHPHTHWLRYNIAAGPLFTRRCQYSSGEGKLKAKKRKTKNNILKRHYGSGRAKMSKFTHYSTQL